MATWTVEEVRVTPTRCASHHHWPGWFSIMPPLLPARQKSLLVASIKTERLTADWARVQVSEWLDETVGLPQHAEAFNQSLSWDTSRVKQMGYMFEVCCSPRTAT